MPQQTSAAQSPSTSPPSRAALIVIFLTVFIDLLGFGMVLPLLALYGEQFTSPEWRGLLIGLLMSSFSAMQLLFSPIWGMISDSIGRRPVLLIGLCGSAVFYVLFGLATAWNSLLLLFVARLGAGAAGATIPTAQAYIADVTSQADRTKGMALIGAAFGLGFTLGPLLAYFAIPAQIDVTAAIKPGPGPGYVAGGLSAAAFLLAVWKLPESLRSDSDSAVHLPWQQGGLPSVLRSHVGIVLALMAIFLMVLSFAGFESTISLTLGGEQQQFRLRLTQVCLTFAYIGFIALIAQGTIRSLTKYVSDWPLMLGGGLCEIAGFCLLATAGQYHSQAMLYVSLAFVVGGFAFFQTTLNSLLSRLSPTDQQGAILGLAQSLGALARILGPVLAIRVFYGLNESLPMFPMWLSAGMMAVAVVLAWGSVRRQPAFA